MLIGFEAKRFFKNYTGLGNYSRFIINALSDYFPDNQYYLYSPTITSHPEVNTVLQKKNISVFSPASYYPKFAGSIWRTVGIGKESSVKKLQIFHGLSQELPIGLPSSVKKVVTVHDLIFLRYSQFYNPIDVKIYTAKVKYACKSADRIIAISNQTASDICEYLGVEKSKIDVVYQGCHPIFKTRATDADIKKIKEKYGLPDKYLLSVGTIEERKNALLIVKAMHEIPENLRLPLVLAGKPTKYLDVIKDFVRTHKMEKWIKYLHNAAFTDFPALYQGAHIFIYPSIFEGFGIPLVEATESGVPVITSTGSSFTEAAGAGAMFIDSKDYHSLADTIVRVSVDSSLREKMINLSSDHILRFQPKVIATDLMTIYQSMVGAVTARV